MISPFLIDTDKPLVAIQGTRCGYIQLAPSQEITHYEELPESFLNAAKAWASDLEALGAKRVYWIMLSEVVPHLHFHLYPRWEGDEISGLPLFEQRDTEPQPVWTEAMLAKLASWQAEFNVCVKSYWNGLSAISLRR